MRTPLLAALMACQPMSTEQDNAWSLDTPWTGDSLPAAHAGPPDFVFESEPLRSGEPTVLSVRGLPGNTLVRIGLSLSGVGPGPCPSSLAGGCLGILAPASPLPIQATTNASGVATLTLNVPPVTPGRYVALQAVAPQVGLVSNVIGTNVSPAGSYPGPAMDFDGDNYNVSNGDCSDANNSIYPGAQDVPGDGIDANCDGYDGQDPSLPTYQERHFENVSTTAGKGQNEWLAGGRADVAQQPTGELWKLHVPTGLGPGLQIWTMDPGEPGSSYVNRTLEMLPTEAGRPGAWPTGIFIDLNDDGFDDILVVRDKGSQDAHGFLYDPDRGQFDPLPFNEDHDGDSSWVDGTQAFFGNKNFSYHTRGLQRGDFDGDGDDDLFVARRFGNYIFENTTDGASWTIDDARTGNTIHQRFRPHNLDRIAIDSTGSASSSILNEWANTPRHTELFLPGLDHPFIAAADSVCESAYCLTGRGVGDERFVHLYGLRDGDTACAPNNGLCEQGEMAAGDPDCLGDYAASVEELSCLFIDHLRMPLDELQPGGIAAVDFNGDGFDDDILIAPGFTAAARDEVEACFADPTGCGTIDGYGSGYKIVRDRGTDYFPASPIRDPLFLPYQIVQGMEGLDIDGDGTNEVAVLSGITQFGDGVMHAYDFTNSSIDELPQDGVVGDLDVGMVAMSVADVDRNGGEDLLVTNIQGERAYLAPPPGDQPRLDLHMRHPRYSNNMGPPLLVDLDADGDLDAIVKTWADTDRDVAKVVAWENNGQGYFTDRSDPFAGLPIGLGGSFVSFDYDNDGDQDLLVSQTGPMLLLENQSAQGAPFTFQDRSYLLPPYYTDGGLVQGESLDSCYGVTASPGNQRCYAKGMEIADIDGNGLLDVVIASRKGMNDVLFNDAFGTDCPRRGIPCPRVGFLSARTDLGIKYIFPASDTTGYSTSNRVQTAMPVRDMTASGRPDVIVITSPFETATTANDALFSNEITSPLPHGVFCETDAECDAGETCRTTNGFSALLTCQAATEQRVEGGWFDKVPDAFPMRGGAVPAAPYRGLGCSAFGDINGDGYQDVAMFVNTGEYQPELNGVQSLSQGSCALYAGDTGTDCDVYFTCYINHCEVENPDGLHVGGPQFVYPDTDPRCCVQTEATSLPIAAPSCLTVGRSNPDRCAVRGFRYNNPVEELRPSESELFFYIYNPIAQAFDEYARPIDSDLMAGSESKSCALVDIDGDGDQDFIHTAYHTASLPEQRLRSPQLPTSAHYERRRKLEGLLTSMWLNPGWDDPLRLGTPFAKGDFVQRLGKDYFLDVGDIDGDRLPEVILSDANTMSVFDDAD